MLITATETNRKLVIDFDGTTFTIPPIPGRLGREATALLIGVTFGGAEDIEKDTSKLTRLVLGEDQPGFKRRFKEFENLRASEQTIVAQAAILWNCNGGSLDAVRDLIEAEAGEGYPKALGRVMRSSGLGQQYELLRTWLNGESPEQNSAEASTADTTTRPGTSNTSAS